MTRILTLLAIASFLIPVSNASAQDFTDAQKEQIQKMFKDYLMDNGEVLLDSVNKYQGELVERERKAANVKAENFVQELGKRDDLAIAGNPKGDVTVVEFFDYNCGYCSRALEEIETLLKDDDNVRVVLMDMPILGPPSLEASKWSLAAQKQNKYWEYHRAIMHHKGQKDVATLKKLAKDLDLDVDQLEKDKDSKEIADMLDKNIADAQSLNIRGTPGFIIGGEISPGYIPVAEMKRIIADVRKDES